MQTAEQIIVNYQQLLGAAQYEAATARAAVQQLAAQLSEAQAEIARLKEENPPKSRGRE